LKEHGEVEAITSLRCPTSSETHHRPQSITFAIMTRFFSFAACGLLLLQPLVTAIPQPCLDELCTFTRSNLSPQQVARELGPRLCRGSSIYGPSDPRFAVDTARYQAYAPPIIKMVVQPACETDIPKIVSMTQLFKM
jgi:hypothetical protein